MATEKELRELIVNTAKAWLGCCEADGTHKKIIDLYNSHKPLARGYAVKYTDAWCSTFASAVAIKAGLTSIIPTECSCEKHIALFKNMGCWVENDAYVPSPGDYIFYDWDDSGTGDCTGAADHVGIVTAVSGDTITVIEGNKTDAVSYRTMKVNGKYIRGYGTPNYASKATTITTNTEAEDAIEYLGAIGVINTPSYWYENHSKAQYLDQLLINAAKVIKAKGTPALTVNGAISALVSAGVINSPDYWTANHGKLQYLDSLLMALGGSV